VKQRNCDLKQQDIATAAPVHQCKYNVKQQKLQLKTAETAAWNGRKCSMK
jgi:hypothetical protein